MTDQGEAHYPISMHVWSSCSINAKAIVKIVVNSMQVHVHKTCEYLGIKKVKNTTHPPFKLAQENKRRTKLCHNAFKVLTDFWGNSQF